MLNGFKRGHKRFLLTISLGFLIIHISKQPIHHTNQIFFTDFHPCCNRQCDGPIFAQFPLKFYFQPLFLTSLFFFFAFFFFFLLAQQKHLVNRSDDDENIYIYTTRMYIYVYTLDSKLHHLEWSFPGRCSWNFANSDNTKPQYRAPK